MAIHAAAEADDLFGIDRMETKHGRKSQASGIDAIAAKCEAGAAAVDDYRREHSERMPPNTVFGVALLRVADIGQFADEAERMSSLSAKWSTQSTSRVPVKSRS